MSSLTATPLTLEFIERQPLEAAEVLTDMAATDAAALLALLPGRYAVALISACGAWAAAQVLAQSAPHDAAALLAGADYRDAAAILRMLPDSPRSAVLAHMPPRLARDFRASLAFPEDTVGAHMTTHILAMTGEHRISDARKALGKATEAIDALFVIDAEHRFLGMAPLGTLLRKAARQTLAQSMDSTITTLSARQSLRSAARAVAWDRCHYLPVLSRGGHLIGALPRESLRALTPGAGDWGPPARASFMGVLIREFVATAVSLVQILTEADRERSSGPSKPK